MKTKTFTFSKEIENKLQTNCTSNLIQIFGNIPIEYFLLHCNTVVDKYMKIRVIVKVYCKSAWLFTLVVKFVFFYHRTIQVGIKSILVTT